MDNIMDVFEFIQGVLLDTSAGPFIIALTLIYAYMRIKDIKYKKRLEQLKTHVTILGKQIMRGSGISIKLTSTDGWKTGVFLGANKDGFLIIQTENNSKIMVDPNYVSDIRVFDPN